MDTIKVGNFLKVLRKEKGLTQEMLGAQIGVTNKTISRWENGNYLPPVECLKVLAEFYDVSINEIILYLTMMIEVFYREYEDKGQYQWAKEMLLGIL